MTVDAILIDVGTGNLHSVYHALISLGYKIKMTDQAADIKDANKIILPGVGAFARFMEGIARLGMEGPLRAAFLKGIPILGICVGMQALFDVSEEMGENPGLALLPGRVMRFPDSPDLKVPHTGWNQLWPQRESPLFSNLKPGCYTYFNHSYYCCPHNPLDSAVMTDYGASFTSIAQRDNLFGVQFHPEKSQQVGLRILENFLRL